MKLMADIGIKQIHKMGEELCGDTVEVVHQSAGLVLVLSDGMGSGVKANILSTLTAKIASKMISEEIEIGDVVETLIGTLPVCSERNLAYSTFTIIRLFNNGWAHLVDFDGCDVVHIQKDGISLVERTSYEVGGREIHEANIRLEKDEALVAVSDGVMHAGLGTMFPKGLSSDGLMDILGRYVNFKDSSKEIAEKIIAMCNSFYFEEPLDDATAVVLRVVEERKLILMTGPPKEKTTDVQFVRDFLALEGRKIISGGTTSQIFARESNRTMHMDSNAIKCGRPPTAKIRGVDLVTEGVLTLNRAVELIEKGKMDPHDPAGMLAAELLDAHRIMILHGQRINPAYNGGHGLGYDLRSTVLVRLINLLKNKGKVVEVKNY